MIDIGQKMRFVPYWFKGMNDTPGEREQKKVIGKVIYVDRAHKKFTVKFPCGGTEMKETFKLSQIGKYIHVVRGGGYGR